MNLLKKIIKKIVVEILWLEARLIIWKYQPKIVGVTGSVGKTSTKDAITTVLSTTHSVRGSQKSYNSELGVPLTIIGASSAWLSPLGWLKIMIQGLGLIIFKNSYPAWLVLEVGADRPGDIVKVAKKIRFNVAVVTNLPAIPVHVEFFPSAEAVALEKMSLPKSLSESGLVILNADDPLQTEWRSKIKAHVLDYGLQAGQVRGVNEHLFYGDQNDQMPNKFPVGLTFKLEAEGNSLPVRLLGVVGHHQIYSALAAAAVGLKAGGLNLIQIVEALQRIVWPAGRLRLIPGIKQSLILDDTYNSSPAALSAALKTLNTMETLGRKIVVIGDMMELGEYTIEAHKEIGRQAAGVVDLIVTVGLRAKFVAEGAKEKKFSLKHWKHFDDAVKAGEYLDKTIKTGDTVLIKGSQSIRLEKAVEAIMAEPDKKALLLCRQEREWAQR